VLTVDGESFPSNDPDLAYGSGILATGKGRGWYAILATNPLVRDQGVRHRRLLLYKPRRALIVLDLVRSHRRHVYRRFFQLGPEIDAERHGRRLLLSAPGFAGSLRSSSHGGPRLARGIADPVAGWSFPDYREKAPRTRVEYRSRARNADFLAVLGLDGRDSPRARLVGASRRRTEVALSGRGPRGSRVVVSRRGDGLVVASSKHG
jgi:hypothetical protein